MRNSAARRTWWYWRIAAALTSNSPSGVIHECRGAHVFTEVPSMRSIRTWRSPKNVVVSMEYTCSQPYRRVVKPRRMTPSGPSATPYRSSAWNSPTLNPAPMKSRTATAGSPDARK